MPAKVEVHDRMKGALPTGAPAPEASGATLVVPPSPASDPSKAGGAPESADSAESQDPHAA